MLETREGAHVFGAGHVFHVPPDAWHALRFDEATILVEANLKAGETEDRTGTMPDPVSRI